MSGIVDFVESFRREVSARVGGWFYDQDLILFYLMNEIQRAGGISGHLCELGCYEGKSAIALARLALPDDRLYLFDFMHPSYAGRLRANLQGFCAHLGHRLDLCEADLSRFTAPPRHVPEASLRFIHIDAGHRQSDVFNDLRNFVPLLAPGGIIALDDFFHHQFPGIATATIQFLLSDLGQHLRPFASSHYKLYLCARPWQPFYQKWIYRSGIIPQLSVDAFLDADLLLCYSDEPWPEADLRARFGPRGQDGG